MYKQIKKFMIIDLTKKTQKNRALLNGCQLTFVCQRPVLNGQNFNGIRKSIAKGFTMYYIRCVSIYKIFSHYVQSISIFFWNNNGKADDIKDTTITLLPPIPHS